MTWYDNWNSIRTAGATYRSWCRMQLLCYFGITARFSARDSLNGLPHSLLMRRATDMQTQIKYKIWFRQVCF